MNWSGTISLNLVESHFGNILVKFIEIGQTKIQISLRIS